MQKVWPQESDQHRHSEASSADSHDMHLSWRSVYVFTGPNKQRKTFQEMLKSGMDAREREKEET